jgi:hypothetical protein
MFGKLGEVLGAFISQDGSMTKKAKILLVVSLTAFLVSSTGILWGLFLPVGAIFFGLFMIFNALGKEAALFDEEQKMRARLAEKFSRESPASDTTRTVVRLTPAHSR